MRFLIGSTSKWAPAPTCSGGWSRCTISTPRGNRPRSSSGTKRILRQGNSNAEVAVYRYVKQKGASIRTCGRHSGNKSSFYFWHVMTGAGRGALAEDVGGQELSAVEVKAIASGNPAVLVLAEADAELQPPAVFSAITPTSSTSPGANSRSCSNRSSGWKNGSKP